ncbi:MAG: NAD(P)-dependent glycerol-3-phosphate dehydrogenase [Legionellaceae bacterium]|nr:NAD(P)-dependent glycerol-3-phosphate dehydrogenase [Legionellaceae bacterium]
MKNPASISILGAGSWGTAMAVHLALAGHPVCLWSHRTNHIDRMQQERKNQTYLPDIPFPESLQLTSDLTTAVLQADYSIIAVPSHAFKDVLCQLPANIKQLAWLTKGLDPASHSLLSDLVEERYSATLPMAMISGPSFAKEVALSLPTAVTIAANDPALQQQLHPLFHHHHMRVYLSQDMTGVQLCGAVKNILAIACGISEGMGFGANAQAALITRGLAEMRRLGAALGAQEETFMGLAGVGDLVLTCTDNQSRNRRFGLILGQGTNIDDAERSIGQVVEGKHNADQVCALAASQKVEMPICEQINLLLQNKIDLPQMVYTLFNRPPKDE